MRIRLRIEGDRTERRCAPVLLAEALQNRIGNANTAGHLAAACVYVVYVCAYLTIIAS